MSMRSKTRADMAAVAAEEARPFEERVRALAALGKEVGLPEARARMWLAHARSQGMSRVTIRQCRMLVESGH